MSGVTQFEVADPPTDAISAVQFSSKGTKLLVASWDRKVYLYTLDGASSKLEQTYEHRAPVLDVCWHEDERQFYTAGLDWDVRRVDIISGDQAVLSSHDAGVKALAYSAKHNLLVSASWDSTLHVHHTNQPDKAFATIPLPHKPFSLAITPTKLVVAMAARALHIYDVTALALATAQAAPELNNPSNSLELEPWQRRESSLKFMTRAVACMPNDAGYASSSIEGRVAVEWFDPDAESQARKYAFKCHRQPATDGSGADIVYPVNALAFHPVHGTFASAGGDGVVALWDGVAKRRIRQYQRYPASVAALSFSHDGRWLAIAVSSGLEDGKEPGGDEAIVKLIVRELADGEAKGKDKDKDKDKAK